MTAITAYGVDRTRLDERLASLEASVKGIFGDNISIDPDTPDGQKLGIFAESIANLDQLVEDVYNAGKPDGAVGTGLSRIVQYNAIKRIGGVKSSDTITVEGTSNTIIPANSVVRSTVTGADFLTSMDVTIPDSGITTVPALARTVGATIAPAGSLTKIMTPIFGWQTATNALDAVPGRPEETDEQLKIRRAGSTATPAQSLVDALFGALGQVPNVTQVVVKDNRTDSVNSDGLPPHSIYSIVQGGLDADIAQVIWQRMSMGATLVGSTTTNITDIQGNVQPIKFSRPTAVPIYIVMGIKTYSGWPSDGSDQIKAAIVAWSYLNQGIGADVVQSRLYEPANTVPGHSIHYMHIGTAPAPTLSDDIPIGFDSVASFDAAHIVVVML